MTPNEEFRTITIFDTTLRDGEQSPGASMNLAEKLEVAAALADLGVDVLEAGFPIASPGDFESVRKISETIKGVTICGLARCKDSDIIAAGEALVPAEKKRIHIFLATSPIHREHKLRMSKEQIIELAVSGVKKALDFCDDVEFSAEDACRTEIDYLAQVTEAVIAAGAKTVNIPDTVGYTTPTEMYDRIAALMKTVSNVDKAVLSVHCHNDLGMAVANSLAAVQAGAGQVECCINGLGERAGNGALEEIVMGIRTRSDIYRAKTGINTQKLVPLSRLISSVTGLKVPRNKPIVGQNAFAHESGIHQDGVLKERTTYEIMRAEDVGFAKNDLVLGKHSGRAAIMDRAKSLGFELVPEQLDQVFIEFKKLADRKKQVFDGDLIALIEQCLQNKKMEDVLWTFVSYELLCGTDKPPKAVITLKRNEEMITKEIETGDGPVDALVLAILDITKTESVFKEYNVASVGEGEDALGEVSILFDRSGETLLGRAVSTDIIEGTILAVLNAINR